MIDVTNPRVFRKVRNYLFKCSLKRTECVRSIKSLKNRIKCKEIFTAIFFPNYSWELYK